MTSFERILVPIDFDPSSTRALDYALDLAVRLGGARVVALHVYEYSLSDIEAMPGSMMAKGRGALRRERADADLQQLLDSCGQRGVSVESTLIQGRPAAEIVNYARDAKFDLVVMGTHGRKGIKRAIIGSVAEEVVRTSSVPVLIVSGG